MDAVNQRESGREAFQTLIGHLVAHVDGADEGSCAECRVLRDRYRQDRSDRLEAPIIPGGHDRQGEARYRWRRPSRLRYWRSIIHDVPLLILDRVTEDDPRYLQLAMATLLIAFGLAMALWVAAWALR